MRFDGMIPSVNHWWQKKSAKLAGCRCLHTVQPTAPAYMNPGGNAYATIRADITLDVGNKRGPEL